MLNKSLIDRLHDAKIINRNSVLWWQLGFEGRKVYTGKEFSENLRGVKYQAFNPAGKKSEYYEETLNIWVENDVPILLGDITLADFNIPVFTTVKPMSHSPSGWGNLRSAIELEWPATHTGMIYEQPHIRGVVIDLTDDFLFFYPFLMGDRHRHYETKFFHLNNEDVSIVVDPIHPTKFYKNLIEREWKGRRCQRKPSCLDLAINDLEFVPFFEFDVNKPHTSIYPLPVFEGNLKKLVDDMIQKNPKWDRQEVEFFLRRYHPEKIKKPKLDLPIILSNTGNGKVNLLGAGYSFSDQVFYWPLDERKYNIASQGLKDRLGLEAEK